MKKVSEEIYFYETGGDEVFRLQIGRNNNFDFKIGDTVYSEIPLKVIYEIKWFYPHTEIEGVIKHRWVNLSAKRIVWTVDVDFVRCDL